MKAYIFAFLTSPKCKLIPILFLITFRLGFFLLIIPTLKKSSLHLLDDSSVCRVGRQGLWLLCPVLMKAVTGTAVTNHYCPPVP